MATTEITHREPRSSKRSVEDLYVLLERHGDDVMRAAMSRAVARDELTVTGVRRALRARRGGGVA